ncbi:hypothetical protein HFP89_14680 [Wenzhouxiangella sp. XN79A]|uniref:hypothetical protein n=1 Tax=Wenzhouxiangella sp. XN79A TaxID=2724193 RepID=UPI00144A5485|nr:hypothetical protein [Wenzhouxiangella sp. XN79A]NKI36413.1 hypothetical protein [Wenzhouxiangella sp. XN79A]
MSRLPALIVLAALVLATYIMLADYLNLRAVPEDPVPSATDVLPLPQPWGGYAWRGLARQAGDTWRQDPTAATETLRAAAVRYPVDAVQWLDRARIEAVTGTPEAVDTLLAVAGAVQPFERRSLWSATQVALQSGNPQLAERQLRRWLRDHPQDTERALFVGRRWIDAPGALLDRVLPEGRDYLDQALRIARRQRDPDLADAAWARIQPTPGHDAPAFLDYIETLLDAGRVGEAQQKWLAVDPAAGQGGIVNGRFDREFGEGLGLNWRTERAPAGVRIQRDTAEYTSAPASLRIDFGGQDNIHLAVPWTRVPVEPGARLVLTGSWRADGLTTRARPYLLVTAEGARLNARLEVPGANFDWQPFELDIDVPEDTRLLRLTVRRDRTNAFDRNIAGTLRLDDLDLQPRPEPAEP